MPIRVERAGIDTCDVIFVAVEDLSHRGVAADDCPFCLKGLPVELGGGLGVGESLPACCRADVVPVPDYAVD